MSTLYRSVNGINVPLSKEEEAEILAEWEANAPNQLLLSKQLKSSFITNKRNEALANLTTTWDGDEWDADEATSNRIANALSMVREAKELGIPTPPA